MVKLYLLIAFSILMVACKQVDEDQLQVKNEIVQTEADFATMANEQDIITAFLHFAADSAVLLRENQLIKGKASIAKYMEDHPFPPDATLQWKPDFVEVSESGDLAYTYGKFTFSVPDENQQMKTSEGVFHTVWKRQSDGSWKYVWD